MKEEYIAMVAAADERCRRLQSRINQFSALRLFVALAGIALFYCSLGPGTNFLPVLVVFLTILIFSFVVRAQNHHEKLLQYHRHLRQVYNNEINMLAGSSNIYSDGDEWRDDHHIYSADLDIFGKQSLFELLNRCASHGGKQVLASWLSAPASFEEITARQEAVKDIASDKKWRFHFQATLLFDNGKSDYSEQFLNYLRLASIPANDRIRFYVRWNPWIFIAAAAASFWYLPALLVVLILGIINLGVAQFYGSLVLKADSALGKMQALLGPLTEAMEAVASIAWMSAKCKKLSVEFEDTGERAIPSRLRSLQGIISRLNLGLSTVGPVLNFVTTWNMRQFLALEDWKSESRADLKKAFVALSEFEALNSLASLVVNNPEWAFPDIVSDEEFVFHAVGIGHPLIPVATRVDNDYSQGNSRHVDLVTGSNMAGKSTFLRTLGINTVLALAGSPVCAVEMRLSIMRVFSYMRIRDSISGGTSTFKAELDRLRQLLELLETDRSVFFLIDEMLRGTNSGDRYRGSKGVIKKLVGLGAAGIVATHDLKLAELENEYPGYVRNFHFDIHIDGEEMVFSYRLKSGPCQTFNAAVLLRKLGIEE